MNAARSSIRCTGCGWAAAAADAYPFRCANADDDVEDQTPDKDDKPLDKALSILKAKTS